MKRYCLKFECPCRECAVHPDKGKNDNSARYRNFEGNPELCEKKKSQVQRYQPVLAYVPSESEEQQALKAWVDAHIYKYPVLKAFYHIPNEGKRSKYEGERLKREGLKEGVSDNCLPVQKSGYGSLYIELKKRQGAKVSDAQSEWIELMKEVGNAAFVCEGWEQAAKVIEDYLEGRCECGESL